MRTSFFLLCLALTLTSCVGIFTLRNSSQYNYRYMAKNEKDEIFYFYENMPYDKGDTIILFPQKKEIVILCVTLNEQKRPY